MLRDFALTAIIPQKCIYKAKQQPFLAFDDTGFFNLKLEFKGSHFIQSVSNAQEGAVKRRAVGNKLTSNFQLGNLLLFLGFRVSTGQTGFSL